MESPNVIIAMRPSTGTVVYVDIENDPIMQNAVHRPYRIQNIALSTLTLLGSCACLFLSVSTREPTATAAMLTTGTIGVAGSALAIFRNLCPPSRGG